MRFVTFKAADGSTGLAVRGEDGKYRGLSNREPGYPGDLQTLLGRGGNSLQAAASILSRAATLDRDSIQLLPPLPHPAKILCIGLNYVDHTKESGMEQPRYPAVFARYSSSLIGHQAPIVRPRVSEQLDYEGELVAVIGKAGRHIDRAVALDFVAGYSLFNDASVRDYQMKSTQWTVGKNFDGTGAFGPEFVTADEVPPGAAGLRIETRLNGATVQSASTDDLMFDVATLVSLLSVSMTLLPGDIIVTGTPSGVGMARTPQLWMKPGDVCEVEIQGLGVLRNPVIAER